MSSEINSCVKQHGSASVEAYNSDARCGNVGMRLVNRIACTASMLASPLEDRWN